AGGDATDVIDPGRVEAHAAGADIDRLARVGLERAPEAEGVEHPPGVAEVGVRVPGDPRRPVRAAAVVAEPELLDQQHRLAPPGQVIRRRRADGAGAEDDEGGVEGIHEGLTTSRTKNT